MPAATPVRLIPTFLVPLCEQTLFTVPSAMLLDGGRVATAGLYVSLAFWFGAFVICLRRPDALTRGDRAYLNLGLIVAWFVGVPLYCFVWSWKGV